MKVTRNTPQQMIVAQVPWGTGYFLIAAFLHFSMGLLSEYHAGEKSTKELLVTCLFLVGIFCFAFYGLVERIQIILDRTSNVITIRRRTVIGYKSEKFTLSDLIKAEVEVDNSGGDGPMYRPIFRFRREVVPSTYPIRSVYTSWSSGQHEAVDAINAWLPAQEVDSDSQSA